MRSGLGFPLEVCISNVDHIHLNVLQGCLQSYRVFDERSLIRIPDHMSYEQASTLPIAAGTAWVCRYLFSLDLFLTLMSESRALCMAYSPYKLARQSWSWEREASLSLHCR